MNSDLRDPLLRLRIGQLHGVLVRAGEEFEAASRLALVSERLRARLRETDVPPRPPRADPPLARRLRELLDERLDERLVDGIALDEAARLVHAHPAHLVRAFSTAFGMPPHQYLTARRVERARRLLLDGRSPGEVAAVTGFYDQAHLTWHFKKLVGVPPGRYRLSGGVSR